MRTADTGRRGTTATTAPNAPAPEPPDRRRSSRRRGPTAARRVRSRRRAAGSADPLPDEAESLRGRPTLGGQLSEYPASPAVFMFANTRPGLSSPFSHSSRAAMILPRSAASCTNVMGATGATLGPARPAVRAHPGGGRSSDSDVRGARCRRRRDGPSRMARCGHVARCGPSAALRPARRRRSNVEFHHTRPEGGGGGGDERPVGVVV